MCASARVPPAVVLILGLVTALFLVPMALHGPVDREEHYLGVLSSLVHFEHLYQGRLLFWYDNLGLGTPLPLGHDFNTHPLFALWPWVPLPAMLLLFWFVHLLIGSVFVWRTCRRLGTTAAAAYVGALTFLLASPTLNYVYSDDWPSVVFGWAMFPVLVFYVFQMVAGEHSVSPAFSVVRLGVLFGFTAVTVHQGHAVTLFTILGVFVAVLLLHRRGAGLIGLALASGLAAVLSAEAVYYVLAEAQGFPRGIDRDVQEGFALSAYLHAAPRPFVPGLLARAPGLSPGELFRAYVEHNAATRIPFFGLVFLAVAALAVPLALLRPPTTDALRVAAMRAGALAFVLAVAASTISPTGVFTAVSGAWLFRDPGVFFGVLLAGMVLSAASARWSRAVTLLLAIQCGQLALAALPATVAGFGRPAPPTYWHVGTAVGSAAELREQVRPRDGRLYLSAGAERQLRESPALLDVYDVTGLALVGVPLVNGRFKGTSMDRLYASSRLMNGQIVGNLNTVQNPRLLDVIGVTHVFVTLEEYGDGAAFRHLEPVTSGSSAAAGTGGAPRAAPGVPGCPTAAELQGTIVQVAGGGNEYYVDNGRRREVPGADTLAALGLAGAPRRDLPARCVDPLPVGAQLGAGAPVGGQAPTGGATTWQHSNLVLLRNPTAWGRAALLPIETVNAVPPRRAGCDAPGLFCADVAALASMRLPEEARVTGQHGQVTVQVAPVDAPRLLLVSAMYRPEWRATAGGAALQTFPVASALLGVELPPGVAEVRLDFEPRTRQALLLAGLAALGIAVVVAAREWARQRSRRRLAA